MYALLQLTVTIIKTLDDSNFTCGIFVDFQKAFDTLDHRMMDLKWFDYYLSCNVLFLKD